MIYTQKNMPTKKHFESVTYRYITAVALMLGRLYLSWRIILFRANDNGGFSSILSHRPGAGNREVPPPYHICSILTAHRWSNLGEWRVQHNKMVPCLNLDAVG